MPNPDCSQFTTLSPGSSGSTPFDVRAYWTPERKKAAIPIHRFRSGAMVPSTVDEITPDADNSIPTTEPKQADRNVMPFITGGKLFFTLDGKDMVGSANVFMRSNMVLTAAHCIQDEMTGNLAEHFLFQRGFSGEVSDEDFGFKTVALKEQWYKEKDTKWDYAIAILDGNSTVPTPLKYTTEDVSGRTVTAMGYPVNYFGGAQMMYLNGTLTSRLDTWAIFNARLGQGSSGGAWVLEDNVTAAGVMSYFVTTAKGGVYIGSPKFDGEFESLYRYALTQM